MDNASLPRISSGRRGKCCNYAACMVRSKKPHKSNCMLVGAGLDRWLHRCCGASMSILAICGSTGSLHAWLPTSVMFPLSSMPECCRRESLLCVVGGQRQPLWGGRKPIIVRRAVQKKAAKTRGGASQEVQSLQCPHQRFWGWRVHKIKVDHIVKAQALQHEHYGGEIRSPRDTQLTLSRFGLWNLGFAYDYFQNSKCCNPAA